MAERKSTSCSVCVFAFYLISDKRDEACLLQLFVIHRSILSCFLLSVKRIRNRILIIPMRQLSLCPHCYAVFRQYFRLTQIGRNQTGQRDQFPVSARWRPLLSAGSASRYHDRIEHTQTGSGMYEGRRLWPRLFPHH